MLDIPGAFAAYRSHLQQCNVSYLNTLGIAVCRWHQYDMVKLRYPSANYKIWSQLSLVTRYMGFYIIDADNEADCFLCQQSIPTKVQN
jgi:hypothetical protein